jgi:Ca2+-binding EF-hand superfamily protein
VIDDEQDVELVFCVYDKNNQGRIDYRNLLQTIKSTIAPVA